MTRLTLHLTTAMGFAALLLGSSAAQAQKAPAQDPLAQQKARAAGLKTKGHRVFYTQKFDLSDLPEYKPTQQVSGVIRQWGSNYLADSPLAQMLEDGFRKYHPNVTFEDNLGSTFIGVAGLYTKKADIAAMGRRPTWDELQGYQRVFSALPVEIVMATGSLDVPGWTFALVPFVNKDNPLKTLTLEQLDGIFGAQRDGGWVSNDWDPKAARGPEKNIRTWGQLGLTGEWADKPIHVYAYNLNYHFPRDFAERVMGGGYKWNETMKEFSNVVRVGSDGVAKLYGAGDQMLDTVGEDKYGITYAGPVEGKNVKTVPLARTANGEYVMPTLETVREHRYPMAREVYYLANREVGKKIEPLFAEFLRYVVSRQGQEAVMKDGKYLPLTAKLSREQIAKIDAVGEPFHASE